jgi:hypothetical protein
VTFPGWRLLAGGFYKGMLMFDALKNIPSPQRKHVPNETSLIGRLRALDVGGATNIEASRRAMACRIYDMKFTGRSIGNGMIRLWRIE